VKNTHSGFTALELLIVLTIVITLLVAGFPSLREFQLNQQLKSSMATLSTDLKLARNEAVKRNTRTIVCPGTTVTACLNEAYWQEGWLVFDDTNGDRQWQEAEPLLIQRNPLSALTALSPASRQQIRFFPGGTAPGSNTSIVFCDQRGFKKGKKIVISNSGRIRQSTLSGSDETRCPFA
jgi:type IV fimbrial biogenesis protein FimT